MMELKKKFLRPLGRPGEVLGVLLALAAVTLGGDTSGDRGGIRAPDEGGETVPATLADPGFQIVGSFGELRGLLIGLERGSVLLEPVDPARPVGKMIATFRGDVVLHLSRTGLERARLKVRFLVGSGGATEIDAGSFGKHFFVANPGQNLRLPLRQLYGPDQRAETLHIDIVDWLQRRSSFEARADGDLLTLSLRTNS